MVAELCSSTVYWIPIRDEVEANVQARNASWAQRHRAALRIPEDNSLSAEAARDWIGLRWYALEPARMAAFAQLQIFYREIAKCVAWGYLPGYSPGSPGLSRDASGGFEHAHLKRGLAIAEKALRRALAMSPLFGPYGLELACEKPMEWALDECVAIQSVLDGGGESTTSSDPNDNLLWRASNVVRILDDMGDIAQGYATKRDLWLVHETGVTENLPFAFQ
jgi:hypothetical protein